MKKIKIGKNMKEVRIMRGLTQENLGEKVHLNYQECRKYENQIIEKVKCLNKMQLLYVLDTIELLNKYNWGDEKIE